MISLIIFAGIGSLELIAWFLIDTYAEEKK